MSNEAKVIFDPKLNFELPKEIGPLLEQTVSVSIAEGFDACFEFSLATQNTVASFEKQFAVAQADAKEMAEKLRSATTQNIDAAFGYALKLAKASTIDDSSRLHQNASPDFSESNSGLQPVAWDICDALMK